MLVEDNHINQVIVKCMLSKDGHHVTVVERGQDALTEVQKNNYDMILMDLNMPIMDGIETTKKIRKLGTKYQEIPVIVVTATISEAHLSKCYEVGMVDCLIKPFSFDVLRKAIATHARPFSGNRINEKTESIKEEFGPEYAAHFVREMIKETQELWDELQESYNAKDYEGVRNSAHDLVSVSGSLGLNSVSAQAKSLENSCEQGNYNDLGTPIETLEECIAHEIIQLKSSIQQ